MAEDADDESKTEEPTEKHISDALERGNVPVSREVTLLMSLAAYLVIETLVLPGSTPQLVSALLHFIDDPARLAPEPGSRRDVALAHRRAHRGKLPGAGDRHRPVPRGRRTRRPESAALSCSIASCPIFRAFRR